MTLTDAALVLMGLGMILASTGLDDAVDKRPRQFLTGIGCAVLGACLYSLAH